MGQEKGVLVGKSAHRPALGNVPGAYVIYMVLVAPFAGSWVPVLAAAIVGAAILINRRFGWPASTSASSMAAAVGSLRWSLTDLLAGLEQGPFLASLWPAVLAHPLAVFVALVSLVMFLNFLIIWLRTVSSALSGGNS